ncbi:hypothetical protein BsWGS_07045 [Bradybaena similaris]
MLLYLVLMLLPATVLAECHSQELDHFFGALDFNGNGNAERWECDLMFDEFDPDDDGVITYDDIVLYAPQKAPVFVGVERVILRFADFDNNGVVERVDTDLTLIAIDTDNDKSITPEEFKIYEDKYCQQGEQH